MKTEFIPCACRSCTSLYIIVHHCTSLYIIVHHCTSLSIIEHPCAPPRCFMFVLRVELKSETRASLIKQCEAKQALRTDWVLWHYMGCSHFAKAQLPRLCRIYAEIAERYTVFTLYLQSPLQFHPKKATMGPFPKKCVFFLVVK